ncbi:hypothetical protein Aeqsu_1170 [Aequorivita sublithincola DSM 14238]|uniref:Lipoprotein n=1 Tax=Aequorivita sublithincola (strain DSM 14238 / LMG 21431 / ACAM 643 / 9-3) TaxID=746697 RepID=I3YUJ8_AEQSU|nr:hypothetical protein [Aequorivita sublithincola]AFL80666.1 hypothetical protein Aeqsu_1170 [Aequorivita sublithincola DSM 14238]
MKTKMKTIAIILTLPILLFALSNCGGAQNIEKNLEFSQNPPFKVVDAFYQDWVAGVKEGGSGTNVHITFSEKEDNVVIQNIYFRNQILEAKGNINEPNKYVGYLRHDKQRDIVMDNDPIKEAQNTPSIDFPFQLADNQAVVEYWINGKKNYFKISNLTKKDLIPYPQANPNQHE